MAKRDYYEVLGVGKNAGEEEIKSSYRRLAKQCHPDLHPHDKEAEAKFKEINEAYQILTNADMRARYDQFGFDGPNMGGAGGFGGFEGFDFSSIFDLFGGEFGGRTRRNGPARGADLRYDMRITFEEAAFGVKKEFQFKRSEKCAACNGYGTHDGKKPPACPTCKGTGQVRMATQSIFGQVMSTRPCTSCGGTGELVRERCTKCGGAGNERITRTASVAVPAGIADGQVITMNGQGEPGARGGPAGDLYVFISVAEHKLFKREGYDIHCEIPVSFTQAALGGEIDIPSLEGSFKHMLPEGTQNDDQLRFRGKGIPMLRGSGRGNLFVSVRVDVPRKLSEGQKALLRQFEDSLTGREYETRRSFVERMKDLFTS